jgi:hypothetical protein
VPKVQRLFHKSVKQTEVIWEHNDDVNDLEDRKLLGLRELYDEEVHTLYTHFNIRAVK